MKFIIPILFDCLMDCLETIADAGTSKRAIVVCVCVSGWWGGPRGRSVRLHGSLLGLYSLKQFFFTRDPAWQRGGKAARVKRKGRAGLLKDATVAK